MTSRASTILSPNEYIPSPRAWPNFTPDTQHDGLDTKHSGEAHIHDEHNMIFNALRAPLRTTTPAIMCTCLSYLTTFTRYTRPNHAPSDDTTQFCTTRWPRTSFPDEAYRRASMKLYIAHLPS